MSESPDIYALLKQTSWTNALAKGLVGDLHLAEDLVQDTWVAALEHRPDTRRSVRGWIATVLRNNLGNARRAQSTRAQREESVAPVEATASTYDVVAKAAIQKDLVEAVLALDEPYRSTVLMRFFEGLSYGEVARKTGVTKATVNSRVTRGLERLRKRLDKQFGARQAWLTALCPFVNLNKTLVPTGLLTMTTTTQVTLLVMASTTVAAGVWIPSYFAPKPAAVTPVVAHVPEAQQDLVDADVDGKSLRKAIKTAAAGAPVPGLEHDENVWETTLMHDMQLPKGVEDLRLNTGAGNVEVLPGTGGISIETKVRANTERVDASKLTSYFEDHVLISQEEGTLVIEDRHSKENEGNGWSISLTVRVPEGFPISANSGAGNVTVRAARERVSANSGAGNVSVEMPESSLANVSANSGAGKVVVKLRSINGSLTANSGAGRVEAHVQQVHQAKRVTVSSGAGSALLVLPQDVAGEFKLESGVGSVKAPESFGLTFEKKTVGEKAWGLVGSSAAKYSVSSGAGSVEVRVR